MPTYEVFLSSSLIIESENNDEAEDMVSKILKDPKEKDLHERIILNAIVMDSTKYNEDKQCYCECEMAIPHYH